MRLFNLQDSFLGQVFKLFRRGLFTAFNSMIIPGSCISGIDGFLNPDGRSLRKNIGECIQDFTLINKADFSVWKSNLAHSSGAEGLIGTGGFQISRHQEETVDGRRVAPDLRIDYAGIDISKKSLTLEEF